MNKDIILNSFNDELFKSAGAIRTLLKPLSLLKSKFGKKVLKTTAGVGVLYGGYKGLQYIKRRATEPKYSAYLRNQIRAGRIQPGQVNPQDLSKAFHKPIPQTEAPY